MLIAALFHFRTLPILKTEVGMSRLSCDRPHPVLLQWAMRMAGDGGQLKARLP
jgi:hypothetical protein